jgi:hypothetical protein
MLGAEGAFQGGRHLQPFTTACGARPWREAARECQSMALKWNSPPSLSPDGQREVTVLVRV